MCRSVPCRSLHTMRERAQEGKTLLFHGQAASLVCRWLRLQLLRTMTTGIVGTGEYFKVEVV